MSSYVEIEEALQVIDRCWSHIRDIGLLASALARPAATVRATEAYPELPMKTAALLDSVARSIRSSAEASAPHGPHGADAVDQRLPPRLHR
ncbi:MAG: hypothetical protein ABI568_07070 [Pseudarthrobacter sp.]